MSKENTRNVIILKNLPSNLIAEAILVVKDKKQVAEYMKESEFGANKDVSNCKTYNNGIIYGDKKTPLPLCLSFYRFIFQRSRFYSFTLFLSNKYSK